MEIPDNGTRGLGRAGSYVVGANDPTALWYNPALLTRLRGTQILFDNHLSMLDYRFRRESLEYDSGSGTLVAPDTEFAEIHNEERLFWAPFMAVTSDLGTDNLVLGLGAFGPPAVGHRSFPSDGAQRYMLVESDILMAFYTFGAAYRPHPNLSIGATIQSVDLLKNRYSVVASMNLAELFPDLPPSAPTESASGDVLFKLNTQDRFTLTGTVGLWWRPHSDWEVAISSRPLPINIHSKGHFEHEFIGTTIANIAAEYLEENDNRVTLDVTLPSWVRGGIRYVHRAAGGRELFDVEFNVVYEAWSQLQSFDVQFGEAFQFVGDDPEAGPGAPVPIAPVSLRKAFKDTYSFRLGGDYHLLPNRLTLRAGTFYESAASPLSHTHLDFTASERLGFTTGATLRWNRIDFSLAYALILHPDRHVPADETLIYQIRPLSQCLPPYDDSEKCHSGNPGKPPGVPAGGGTFKSGLHVVSAGLTIHFDPR